MSEETGSQTVESPEVSEAFEMFGLPVPDEVKEETPHEKTTKTEKTKETQSDEESPAKAVRVVKFNKEETEVDITGEKLDEHLQRSLALDKERERKEKYQQALDRAAKLQGFKDHEDFLENLDKIEQEAKKKEEDQFNQLRQELRIEAEEAGLDPEKVESYISNHPLMKEAERIKLENEQRALQEQQEKFMQEIDKQWGELYSAYPDILEDAKAWTRGETPTFYTDEMKSLVERGYHPLHAYQLAHLDSLTSQVKEQARKSAIKDQIYNKRSQVVGDSGGEIEPEVPEELKSAFSLFGLDPKLAKKYVKK